MKTLLFALLAAVMIAAVACAEPLGETSNSLGRGDDAALDFEAAAETSVDESLISLAREQLTLIEDRAAG